MQMSDETLGELRLRFERGETLADHELALLSASNQLCLSRLRYMRGALTPFISSEDRSGSKWES